MWRSLVCRRVGACLRRCGGAVAGPACSRGCVNEEPPALAVTVSYSTCSSCYLPAVSLQPKQPDMQITSALACFTRPAFSARAPLQIPPRHYRPGTTAHAHARVCLHELDFSCSKAQVHALSSRTACSTQQTCQTHHLRTPLPTSPHAPAWRARRRPLHHAETDVVMSGANPQTLNGVVKKQCCHRARRAHAFTRTAELPLLPEPP